MSKFDLSFEVLREANLARLPQFKNAQGGLAHSEPDGSDWSPNDWMTAITGEVGELASIFKSLRRGDFKLDDVVTIKGKQMTVRQWIGKECADIVTYVDITALQFDLNLGDETATKFNEISDRVGALVHIAVSDDPHGSLSAAVVYG